MGNLENLKSLKDNMTELGWSICDFLFTYKNTEYIVLVKRFVGSEKRVSQFALVKLHFMKTTNLNDALQVEANSSGLIIETKTLREYFGIEYDQENLGDILQQFSERLGRSIPIRMPDMNCISSIEKQAVVSSLSKSDSENPNKIFCIGVKRNPNGKTRSEFNADKTKILRKNLYDSFSNDSSISFCYSEDPTREKDDPTIFREFANR